MHHPPRHIIRLVVEMTAPQPTDLICDPACGTAGFLMIAGEYLREHHPNLLLDAKPRDLRGVERLVKAP